MMSRIRHAYLILTGRLPTMENEMIDNTLALAAQLNTAAKALIAALQSELASAGTADAAADQAGVAALQPILNEVQAALPQQPESEATPTQDGTA